VDGRPRRVCPACGHVHWRNAKPCAGALVIRNGKVLLDRQNPSKLLPIFRIMKLIVVKAEHLCYNGI
jgi:NADH pyrophosphatase NudC (nudix superfamily)